MGFWFELYNYARWISVFIFDLRSLYSEDMYNEFWKGHFTVKKSNFAFSTIGEDHAHEKTNKIIKGDGGVIGIFDNEEAVLEWAVCGPVSANMFHDLPDIDEDDYYQFHYESTDNFREKIRNDSKKLFEDFLNNVNPFIQCERDLVNVLSKTVAKK